MDAFFFLSGFLAAFLMLQKMYPKRARSGLAGYSYVYVHRYLRLVPAIVFLFLLGTYILPYLGGGPAYFAVTQCKSKRVVFLYKNFTIL